MFLAAHRHPIFRLLELPARERLSIRLQAEDKALFRAAIQVGASTLSMTDKRALILKHVASAHPLNPGPARGTRARFNEHLDEEDGPLVLAHACKMGLEGIVSKRKDSPYRSGRSPHWIKSKNPTSPAVKREAEEDWGR